MQALVPVNHHSNKWFRKHEFLLAVVLGSPSGTKVSSHIPMRKKLGENISSSMFCVHAAAIDTLIILNQKKSQGVGNHRPLADHSHDLLPLPMWYMMMKIDAAGPAGSGSKMWEDSKNITASRLWIMTNSLPTICVAAAQWRFQTCIWSALVIDHAPPELSLPRCFFFCLFLILKLHCLAEAWWMVWKSGPPTPKANFGKWQRWRTYVAWLAEDEIRLRGMPRWVWMIILTTTTSYCNCIRQWVAVGWSTLVLLQLEQ